MAENEVRLPIKIVLPKDEDLRSVPGRGSKRKIFPGVDEEMRRELLGQVAKVKRHFQETLSKQPDLPAVARVLLKEKALAKSHRPETLFSRSTCPIIGGEMFGTLLVSIAPDGLDRLESNIRTDKRDGVTADVSTIERIEPYTAEHAAGSLGVEGLAKLVSDKKIRSIKFSLFRHKNSPADRQVQSSFFDLVKSLELPKPQALPYLSGLRVFRVRKVSPELIPRLAEFVGTQSVGIFPQFRLFAQYIPQGSATVDHLPPPDPNRDYPVVGLIDSGTDPGNPLIQAWVVDRDEEDVPRPDQDNNHGSFVGGLIINGRKLNHDDHRFPNAQARIVDVVGMPKADTPVEESDLLATIRRALEKHKDVRVWNLSISRTDMVCQDNEFSDFAMELDALQRLYDVTFVICAGNYSTSPLRGWPANDLGESDRAFPPADTALGISVGSMAHLDRENSRVRREEPSPFSRRGPGAAFLPKPEVCHYGGNCAPDLNCHQVGVVSIDGSGRVCEAIGTSFSTPLITSLLGNIRDGVADPVSRNLAKALLIQSAALRNGPIKSEDLRYKGFGMPGEVDEILTCAPWQATLILEPEIHTQRRIFVREDFPIPSCFRRPDGRVEGEFLMTLVYDPPLDSTAGAEYCQANIDVSLGTYDPNSAGKAVHNCKIPAEPRDYGKLYERYLVEHGFKWSPVKVYRAKLERTSGQRWRIYLRMNGRAGIQFTEVQRAALVITLFDSKKKKPVYNDVVTAMNRFGWITEDLRVNERIRARVRS